jgi:hypothetical protein
MGLLGGLMTQVHYRCGVWMISPEVHLSTPWLFLANLAMDMFAISPSCG